MTSSYKHDSKSLKLAGQNYLKPYKLTAHIRNGGFSEIYEGETLTQTTHNNLILPPGSPVIIKRIPKHRTTNWLMFHNKMYPTEILLHKMCNALKGVVRMLEFYEQEHEWIIIMPKLSNAVDLSDFLESKDRGRLSESEACHFFVQLIRINIDLLQHGVVHRDIKAENLLVDMDKMNLVLIDFGASAIHRNTDDNKNNSNPPSTLHFYTDFHGTLQYKPPEYIKHKKYTAQASTVWALGIVLYDMCHGKLPFETEHEILEYNLRVKSKMSDEYKKLLYDCLNTDPTQRPTLIQLLDYAWCLKYSSNDASLNMGNTSSSSASNLANSQNSKS